MQIKMFLKLAVLGGVSILLLIALGSIGGITRERKQRLQEVQQDIEKSYAGEQQLLGPVGILRYRETWTEKLYDKEKRSWEEKEQQALRTALVYPDELTCDGVLDVEERYRGIFKAQTFRSRETLSGNLRFPDIETLRSEKGSTLEWISAELGIGLSDPRGITQVPVLLWNNAPLELQPGSGLPSFPDGLRAALPPGRRTVSRLTCRCMAPAGSRSCQSADPTASPCVPRGHTLPSAATFWPRNAPYLRTALRPSGTSTRWPAPPNRF
jgi:inner membrane protein